MASLRPPAFSAASACRSASVAASTQARTMRIRTRRLRVVADAGRCRHDQAGEQAAQPEPVSRRPIDDRRRPAAMAMADHGGNPHHGRAGAYRHPAVHHQVVEPVHGVDVADKVRKLAQAQQRGPARRHLVVTHRARAGQSPGSGHADRGDRAEHRAIPGGVGHPPPGPGTSGRSGRWGRPGVSRPRRHRVPHPGAALITARSCGGFSEAAKVSRHLAGELKSAAAAR